MMPEEDISDAIARGDRQAVKAWLNAEDSDVNSRSVDGQTLLGTCVLAAFQSQSKYEASNHLEVARMPVAHGARAILGGVVINYKLTDNLHRYRA